MTDQNDLSLARVMRKYETVSRNPLVSLLVPTYKRPQILEDCLCSILTQDYKNIELIIKDDNSQDETEMVVRKYEKLFNIGSRYKYINNKINMGGNENVTDGVKNYLSGKYCMILHDDDFFCTDKIISMYVS